MKLPFTLSGRWGEGEKGRRGDFIIILPVSPSPRLPFSPSALRIIYEIISNKSRRFDRAVADEGGFEF